MKKLVCKLRSRAGESFAEILVAIFIVAMAALLMASMVTASGGLDMKARQEDEAFYKAINAVESGTGTPSDGTVTITSDGGTSVGVEVKVYTDTDGTLSAYEKG